MSFRSFAASLLLITCIAQAGAARGVRSNKIDEPKRAEPVSVGEEAPDFTLEDMQGNQVTLSAARGKASTVLVFYRGYWCPFCAHQLAELRSLMKANEGIRVLAVSVDDDSEAYHKFLKDHHIDLLTVREGGARSDTGVISPLSNMYGTYKIPESYIIDRNGTIRRKFVGSVDWSQAEIVEYLSRL